MDTSLNQKISELKEKLTDCQKRQADLSVIEKELKRQIKELTKLAVKADEILKPESAVDVIKDISKNLR